MVLDPQPACRILTPAQALKRTEQHQQPIIDLNPSLGAAAVYPHAFTQRHVFECAELAALRAQHPLLRPLPVTADPDAAMHTAMDMDADVKL
jgi:hypothetical protein